MNRVLAYFSDCPVMSGSEKTLIDLMQSTEVIKDYDVIFAFRNHKNYDPNFFGTMNPLITQKPLRLISADNLYFHSPLYANKSILRRLAKKVKKIYLSNPFTDVYNLLVLLTFILRVKPAILHANNGGLPGARTVLLCALACRITKTPCVLSINNLFDYNNVRNVNKVWLKLGTSDSITVVGNCGAVRKSLHSIPGRTVKALEIRSAGSVELECLASEEGQYQVKSVPLIMAAGLLERRKGFDVLVASLSQLNLRGVAFGCEILGDGPEKANLERLILERNLSEFLTVRPWSSQWLTELARADMFVMCSRAYEGIPLVVIDALALGKPILGTDVGGIPEAIEEARNGYLVPVGDSRALAGRLQTLLMSPSLRRKMGRQSQEIYARKFRYSRFVGEWRSTYESVCRV